MNRVAKEMQIRGADLLKKSNVLSPKLIARIKALLGAIAIQSAFAGLIFVGGLMDPYLGLLAAGGYFLVLRVFVWNRIF